MSLLYLFEFLLYMFLCAADLYKAWRNHELRAYLNYTMDNIYIYIHFSLLFPACLFALLSLYRTPNLDRCDWDLPSAFVWLHWLLHYLYHS